MSYRRIGMDAIFAVCEIKIFYLPLQTGKFSIEVQKFEGFQAL